MGQWAAGRELPAGGGGAALTMLASANSSVGISVSVHTVVRPFYDATKCAVKASPENLENVGNIHVKALDWSQLVGVNLRKISSTEVQTIVITIIIILFSSVLIYRVAQINTLFAEHSHILTSQQINHKIHQEYRVSQ